MRFALFVETTESIDILLMGTHELLPFSVDVAIKTLTFLKQFVEAARFRFDVVWRVGILQQSLRHQTSLFESLTRLLAALLEISTAPPACPRSQSSSSQVTGDVWLRQGFGFLLLRRLGNDTAGCRETEQARKNDNRFTLE